MFNLLPRARACAARGKVIVLSVCCRRCLIWSFGHLGELLWLSKTAKNWLGFACNGTILATRATNGWFCVAIPAKPIDHT